MSLQSLVGSITDTARRTPDASALIWRDKTVSYSELYARAFHTHARLARLAAADAPLGLFAPKCPESIALVLGCLLAQRRFLLPSATLPEATRAELFSRSGCAAVLSEKDIPSAGPDQIHPAAVFTPDPDRVTFMLTTSGSTGMPKVVPLTEGAIDRFTDWAGGLFGLRPGSAVLNYSSLNFDLCLLDVWSTLKHGGVVVLVDPDRGTNASYLDDLLRRNAVELVQAVPMLFQLLADAAERTGARYPEVRHVIVTGDTITARCLARLPELFPNARIHNLYGCTETNDSLLHELDPAALPTGQVPLGAPLPGVLTLLVAEDGSVLTGPGTGELYVCTPFQTAGYLDPALDEGRFAGHPAGADGNRYFRSGDLVTRDAAGTLTLLGRNDFQVKVRGVRTNVAEVERVLLDHAEVAEAVVVAVPDPLAGHVLHAELRRTPESGLNSLSLRRFCAQRLPRTSIPSTIRIADDPLPRTSTGKPDRHLLVRMLTREG